MPTLPPSSSHQAREMAESFGVDAERYDRARPPYPPELIERLAAASPGHDLLDLGCGTGIASRPFHAKGFRVLGVDPDERMAEVARRSGIEVAVATFEAWEPAGRTFDTAIAAQAWHWVDPVVGAAKVADVLRPNGVFAVFWHAFEPPREAADAFATAFERVVPDAPFDLTAKPDEDVNQRMAARVGAGISAAGAFGEVEQSRYERDVPYTRDAYLDFLPTTGGLTRLPADKLADILDAVGAAVDETFTLHLTTIALTAVRT